MSAQTRSPWSCPFSSGALLAHERLIILPDRGSKSANSRCRAKPLTAADLAADSSTLQDARIWDWRTLEPQLQQIHGLRPYYTFSSVDIDRYQIDGAERQVMITARELDVRRRRAERLVVGMATATASPAHTEPSNDTLERARAVFREMQQEYASGNFARYGELLHQLGKLLQAQ